MIHMGEDYIKYFEDNTRRATERLPVSSQENGENFVYEYREIAYFLDKNFGI